MDMQAIIIVAIAFGSIVAGVAIISATVVLSKLLGRNGARGKSRQAEEARLMQELYHGLTTMEQRIEALETILLEEKRKEDVS